VCRSSHHAYVSYSSFVCVCVHILVPSAERLPYDMPVDEDSTHQSTHLTSVCHVLAGVSLFFLVCRIFFLCVCVCRLLSVLHFNLERLYIWIEKRHYCSPTRLLQIPMFRLTSTVQRKSLSSRPYHSTAALRMVSFRPAHRAGMFAS
jgi:hypothetical protein